MSFLFGAKGAIMLGAGFLLGSLGLKALKSPCARDVYVKSVAKGMQVKAGYENIVEEARAQVEDIVSEASYLNASAGEKSDGPCECKEPSESNDD